MAKRFLGNGGAQPPTEFEADLPSVDVDKDSGLLLVVVVLNLVILLVIPCISVWIRRYQERRLLGDEAAEKSPQLEKLDREQFLELFQSSNVSMKINEQHLDRRVGENDTEQANDEEANGGLRVVRDGSKRVVAPITCAICLEAYNIDDNVVWSSNPDCQHVFHQDCIVDFFITRKATNSESPCPCCRRQFYGTSMVGRQAA